MYIQLLDHLIFTSDDDYYSFADNGLIWNVMEIRCKIYGEYFCPGDDTMDLTEGYISSDSVNTCDDCWDLIELSEYDLIESFSDADLGL